MEKKLFYTIVFYLLYVPLLVAWSIIKGIIVGFFGAVAGAIQKYIISVQDDAAREKYSPLKTLKNWYMVKLQVASSEATATNI